MVYEKACKHELIQYGDNGLTPKGFMSKRHYKEIKGTGAYGRLGKTGIVKVTPDELISRGYHALQKGW